MKQFNYEELKKPIDIVTVISSYQSLEKQGNDYVGLCPFHADQNPSLHVSPSKQIFKCFSCQTGGDVFTYIRKKDGVSFVQAVKKAYQICKVPLPKDFNFQEKVNPYQKELDAIKKLAEYYKYALKTTAGNKALSYLYKRGLNDETIDRFNIGYAPDNAYQAIDYLRKEGFEVETLYRAGILNRESKDLKDRNRDRIVFPISDIHFNMVGFSARKYNPNDQGAKYINSTDSLIFKKAELLYNSSLALNSIKKKKVVYVLEGFMDVIALNRVGIENAVGLMGTALTVQHLNFFKRLGVEVRCLLDSDEPGLLANTKALYALSSNGIPCYGIEPFKDGKDADEILFNKGKEALIAAVNKIVIPYIYILSYNIKANKIQTGEQKEAFIKAYSSLFKKSNLITQDEIATKASGLLNISKDIFLKMNEEVTLEPKPQVQSFNSTFAKPKNNFSSNRSYKDDPLDYNSESLAVDAIKNYINHSSHRNELPPLVRQNFKKFQGLARNEAQILVYALSSKENYEYLLSKESGNFRFYIDSLAELFKEIHELYLTLPASDDLTVNVQLLSEGFLPTSFYTDLIKQIENNIKNSSTYNKLPFELGGENPHQESVLELAKRISLCRKLVVPIDSYKDFFITHERIEAAYRLYSKNKMEKELKKG